MGRVAGNLAFAFNGRAARTTRTNLRVAFPELPDASREVLARESLCHTAMIAAEAVALWTWSLSRLAKLLLAVDGAELIRERSPGRGVIVVPIHHGNWEFLGYFLNTLEPLTPLYQRPKSAAVDQALRKARSRLGHRSAADSTSGLRQLTKTLRAGGMVAILPDQVPTHGDGIVAPFFGREALTMTLISRLLRKHDAEIVLARAIRVAGGFEIRLSRFEDGIRDADPLVSVGALNSAVETAVREAPEQYQWEYKRYRFPGQPNIYR